MKKIFSLLLLSFLVFGNSYAQSSETRDVNDFTGVSFGVAGELILEQGNSFSVVLEGDKDDLEEVETLVRGDMLIIRQDSWLNWGNKKVTVYITMPVIDDLSVSGSGNLIAEKIKADDLEISVSGSGDIDLGELVANSVDCSISGSGTIEIGEGTAGDGELSISGSGKYRGDEFALKYLDVSISGSGSCYTMVEEKLEAHISGSGNVYYSGSPNVDAKVSGSGKVRKR
ncbi:MAG: head GIN domain-containing protein [Bacteroidales bacterium]|nr:head GIN domain-containing protein [Bacteroidales bacterium]